jgi:hypothetical protein
MAAWKNPARLGFDSECCMTAAETRERSAAGAWYKGRDRCRRCDSAYSASKLARQAAHDSIWLQKSSSSCPWRSPSRERSIFTRYSSQGFIQCPSLPRNGGGMSRLSALIKHLTQYNIPTTPRSPSRSLVRPTLLMPVTEHMVHLRCTDLMLRSLRRQL